MLLTVLIQLSLFSATYSQEKWDLKRCVDYALANNISVKQSDLQMRLAAVDLKQDKWSQYPNADFNTTTGYRFGRSIDPNTNTYGSGTDQILSQSFDFQAGVTVFNWHRIRNQITASKYKAGATEMDLAKVKNDIALNVATYYLQVLLSRQQVNIAKIQMAQTREQIRIARKRVDAGAIPELDALTLEGQYATDSSNYIGAQSTDDQNLLQLKAVLNLDAGEPFDIATPPVDQIPIESILDLQPEGVYQVGLGNLPEQKANALRIQSQEATVKAARGALYPTISLGGALGTQFGSSNKTAVANFTGFGPSGDIVKVNNVDYLIQSPKFNITQEKKSFGERWDGWGRQLSDNFRQSLGLTLSVPINNGGQARFNLERSKLNLQNAEITKELANRTLKNDIYKAYFSASAALQKFNAAKTSVEITQKTYDFAVKRFDLGLLNTFDLITSQNNLTRAKLDQASAHFDYVFKMKVLEFYKGQGIKLE